MRETTSNGTENLNNRPPCSHWRPICLPPKETASLRCLIQVNEDDPSAPILSRPRISSTGQGGQRNGGPLKAEKPPTHLGGFTMYVTGRMLLAFVIALVSLN